jgi:DNA-directed RNA polymerase specialized sigma24 family protein
VTNDEFDEIYPQFKSVITALARKIVGGDDELVKDLEQEGAMNLFLLDLSKAKTNRNSWIRQALKYRMYDYLRDFNPGMYESLDARLERGAQIETDANGDVHLITTFHKVPKLVEDDWETRGESIS